MSVVNILQCKLFDKHIKYNRSYDKCFAIKLLCPPPWGVDILFLLFPPSDVRCPLSDVRRPMSGVTHGFRSFKGKVLELLSPNMINVLLSSYYVHPPGGWIYYFCFFRRPMSGVRCPASRMVSAHLKEKY